MEQEKVAKAIREMAASIAIPKIDFSPLAEQLRDLVNLNEVFAQHLDLMSSISVVHRPMPVIKNRCSRCDYIFAQYRPGDYI